MVEQLKRHWFYWKKHIPDVFFYSHKYAEDLLSVWSFSEAEAIELAEAILWAYYPMHFHSKPMWDLPDPKTISEQLILMLRCCHILAYLRMQVPNRLDIRIDEGNSVPPSVIRLRTRVNRQSSLLSVPNSTTKAVDGLLQRSDLMPWLRVSLWTIFWVINKPNQANVSAFLESVRSIQLLALFKNSWFSSFLRENWPLLAIALEPQQIKGQDAVNTLLPFLNGDTQVSIANQLVEIIQETFKQSDKRQKQRLFIALQVSIGLDELLPQLVCLAEPMGITVDELVGAYITVYRGYSYTGFHKAEYSIDQLQKLLITAEEAVKHGDKPGRSMGPLFEGSWSSAPAVVRQARQLLELILDNYSEPSEFPVASLSVALFLKLLAYDTQIQEIAPRFFAILSHNDFFEIRTSLLFLVVIGDFSLKWLSVLQSFLNHEKKAVRVGGALLLKAIIDSTNQYPEVRKNEFQELKNIRIDSNLGMSFINDDDRRCRMIGIALLSLSDYPVEDIKYRNLIWDNLKRPKTDEEQEAWNQLLQEISMAEEKYPMWRKLLEGILGKPSFYSNLVLSAAMQRYQEITNTANLIIPEIE